MRKHTTLLILLFAAALSQVTTSEAAQGASGRSNAMGAGRKSGASNRHFEEAQTSQPATPSNASRETAAGSTAGSADPGATE